MTHSILSHRIYIYIYIYIYIFFFFFGTKYTKIKNNNFTYIQIIYNLGLSPLQLRSATIILLLRIKYRRMFSPFYIFVLLSIYFYEK